MLELLNKSNKGADVDFLNQLMSFIIAYGFYIGIGLVLFLLLKQFNTILNIQVKDVLIILAILFVIDKVTGLDLLEKARQGVLYVLAMTGGASK